MIVFPSLHCLVSLCAVKTQQGHGLDIVCRATDDMHACDPRSQPFTATLGCRTIFCLSNSALRGWRREVVILDRVSGRAAWGVCLTGGRGVHGAQMRRFFGLTPPPPSPGIKNGRDANYPTCCHRYLRRTDAVCNAPASPND